MTAPRTALALTLLCATLVGCTAEKPAKPIGLDESVVLLAAAERAVLPTGPPTTVRFGFDTPDPASRVLPETAGAPTPPPLDLRPRVAKGGAVEFVPSPRGRAAYFPPRCPESAACPRAILEANDPLLLNPDGSPMRFGALLKMTAVDAGPGANVLQKGFSTGGGTQYKVQVDGAAGHPSCVISAGGRIHKLESTRAVTDGRWHGVACTVTDGHLLINVDGTVTRTTLPPGLRVHNDQPLRIGGKSVNPGNDQFAGEIEDVFVSIYPL
ncbi:hypothetical protein GCM10010123_17990 [Pilimelia anulata]|uniref:Concanavalin A-like lectin/glucanase superfamily protein n=1 Tax=Pilimelia anulata TaxID=53371 RepID=A0A8J3B1W0_9ACTN|nr:LamG domain-containing protein [Pilimelia anulata]GGJ88778.1 hypothetical protein GCM10010123_17990 [Pilimelia anulata]